MDGWISLSMERARPLGQCAELSVFEGRSLWGAVRCGASPLVTALSTKRWSGGMRSVALICNVICIKMYAWTSSEPRRVSSVHLTLLSIETSCASQTRSGVRIRRTSMSPPRGDDGLALIGIMICSYVGRQCSLQMEDSCD